MKEERKQVSRCEGFADKIIAFIHLENDNEMMVNGCRWMILKYKMQIDFDLIPSRK